MARLLRAEILQIRDSPYMRISEKLGKKPWWIAWNHIVPQVSRQFVTGLILLFPHAILHEAGVTFLGFGLSSEQPAIGVILSESMSYLITGKWWLALFPGAALVLVTLGFQAIGQSLGRLMDPGSAHE
ncbi:MAG: ABC transporter permease [Clostridium fessum]